MIGAENRSSLYAIDYGREPFCCVRAVNSSEAIGIAERFLALRARVEMRPSRGAGMPAMRAPVTEVSKLRARRPTSAECSKFAAASAREGGQSPYLTAVMTG